MLEDDAFERQLVGAVEQVVEVRPRTTRDDVQHSFGELGNVLEEAATLVQRPVLCTAAPTVTRACDRPRKGHEIQAFGGAGTNYDYGLAAIYGHRAPAPARRRTGRGPPQPARQARASAARRQGPIEPHISYAPAWVRRLNEPTVRRSVQQCADGHDQDASDRRGRHRFPRFASRGASAREGHTLRSLFERVTGEPAAMWARRWSASAAGPTRTPRKAALTIYGIQNGYAAPDPLLEALGPHTTGKSCVYVKRLDQLDQNVLEQLVRKAWENSADET